jgi:hypothetical protein
LTHRRHDDRVFLLRSNRLGCLCSLVVSVAVTVLLLLILNAI